MRKCNVRIEDPHFHEIHHALGCPWPEEVMGETYRNHFSIGEESETAARMKASPHWTDGREVFGSMVFHVTAAGRAALAAHMRANVETPARYEITFRDYDGSTIVSARSRSAAKYAAYIDADLDWSFMEYAALIKSVRLHSRGNIPQQPS